MFLVRSAAARGARVFRAVRCHSNEHKVSMAVCLSGCGVYDGSEIQETVSALIHLDRYFVDYVCFAPDQEQHHVINHATGEATEEKRNCMEEAARISRGNIKPLTDLKVDDFDGVIFPGGFGVAKNLSNFATEGAACTVDSEVARVIQGFRSANKPLGFCCIAPVLAANVLKDTSVTVGMSKGENWPNHDAAAAIEAMGARHVDKKVNECHIDYDTKVVSSPAYMYDTKSSHVVFESVGKMVEGVLSCM